MASSIDISALPAKLKDYALSDNYQILSRLLVDQMTFTAYMQMLIGNDEIPLTELFVEEILQPGNKDTFDPKNNTLKFKARIGKVRPCKVDLQIKPTQIDQMWKSYLGKIAQSTPASPYDLPFEAFLMDRIVRRLKQDLHLKAVFKGVYNAAGTSAVDTMDGLLTKIAADITANNIPAANVTTGAPITYANAIDEVDKLIEKILASPAYGSEPMNLLLSPLNLRKYNKDYQTTHGALPYNNTFEKQRVDGTNITLIAEPGLTGSDRLVATPEENIAWLVDDEQRQDTVIVEKEKRNINIMLDFNAAVEYAIAELIWTNDQA